MQNFNTKTVQGLIFALQNYWAKNGCTIVQPLDIEVGAGTSHPATCLWALNPKPVFAAYVQPSRRPIDCRYGENLSKLHHYYQFQVILKPSPNNMQELYISSLKEIGIDLSVHDIKFIEDNWENPTQGAWGLGWEVWLDGMEITQFTYFQQICGLDCNPVVGEITYGIERISMCIQELDNIYDLIWSNSNIRCITYGDMFYQNEVEKSYYYFKYTDKKFLFNCFEQYEKEAINLLNLKTPLIFPAYECALKAIHNFNLLEARKAISDTERKHLILRIRSLTNSIAKNYIRLYK